MEGKRASDRLLQGSREGGGDPPSYLSSIWPDLKHLPKTPSTRKIYVVYVPSYPVSICHAYELSRHSLSYWRGFPAPEVRVMRAADCRV